MNKKAIQILLLEDDPIDARLIQEYIREQSSNRFSLTWMQRLDAALGQLAQTRPDVILSDLGLPDSFGLETLDALIKQASSVPIIVLTGLDDTELAVKAVQLGAQDYLVKGELTSGLLTRSIRYAIERKEDHDELARQAAELSQRNDELDRLYRASGTLISGSNLTLEELAKTIVEVVQREFGKANCSLFIVPHNSRDLERLATIGPYTSEVKHRKLTIDGPGVVARTITTGKVNNVGDVSADPDYVTSWAATQSELAIPLKVGHSIIGAIDVQSTARNAFSPDDERLMSIFAERAALALDHARLNAQTEASVRQLMALRSIDIAIAGSFDITVSLEILLTQLTTLLNVHAADVLIFNPVTLTFHFANGRGFRSQALRYTNLHFGEGYAGQVARERQITLIQNLDVNLEGLQRSPELAREKFVTYLGVPLIAKGKIKGVLEIFHREALHLDQDGYAFLELLAGQAAIAIDSAELFEDLQSSNVDLTLAYDNTLAGWASALDLRDKDTGDHTRHVMELTIRLAKVLGFNDDQLIQVRRGALLHDIGKMGVPDAVVLKPGPLTEEEWVIMRKHPQYAYDMLSPISFLQKALDIPYCHHEKWDGSGYPRGLHGEQIPFAARIFAIVDVWDALTSDRPYRKAWPKKEAMEYIFEQAGRHFDPGVVGMFLKEIVGA